MQPTKLCFYHMKLSVCAACPGAQQKELLQESQNRASKRAKINSCTQQKSRPELLLFSSLICHCRYRVIKQKISWQYKTFLLIISWRQLLILPSIVTCKCTVELLLMWTCIFSQIYESYCTTVNKNRQFHLKLIRLILNLKSNSINYYQVC